jgi:hypothetical protein
MSTSQEGDAAASTEAMDKSAYEQERQLVKSRALIISNIPAGGSGPEDPPRKAEGGFDTAEWLSECASADVKKLQSCLQELHCDRYLLLPLLHRV